MVYFIYCKASNLVKIGVTRDIKNRFKGLQNSSGVPLLLLKIIEGDERTESDLHIKFDIYRHHGEWFMVADKLYEYLVKELEVNLLQILTNKTETIEDLNYKIQDNWFYELIHDKTKKFNVVDGSMNLVKFSEFAKITGIRKETLRSQMHNLPIDTYRLGNSRNYYIKAKEYNDWIDSQNNGNNKNE